jgi:hypothetical protein
VDAGLLQRGLDMLDQVLGPRQLLLPAVDAHQRPVDQQAEVGGHLGGQLHGPALIGARLQHRPLEPRVVGLVPDRGDQAHAVCVGAADPDRPGQVQDARSSHQLQQRDDFQLVLTSSSGAARAKPMDSRAA